MDPHAAQLRSIAADLGLPRAIRVIDRPPDGLEPPGAPEGVRYQPDVYLPFCPLHPVMDGAFGRRQ